MIASLLVVGGSADQRQATIAKLVKRHLGLDQIKPHPDLLLLEGEPSIGIGQIRTFQKKLALKPYQAPLKIGLILAAEKLTLPAQGALLKTLEEPPARSLLVLGCPTPGLLLPTIVSRCQIVRLPPQISITLKQNLLAHHRQLAKKIAKSRVGERLKIGHQQANNREQALNFLSGQMVVWQQKLRQKPTAAAVENLRQLQRSQKMLEANVNPGLVIGNLLVNLK